MGGSQSARKIGIDSDEAVGVIRVSENVAQRLKNATSDDGRVSSNTSYSNPNSSNSPNPSVTSQQPSGAYIPQPYLTSFVMREEIQKELDKNDRYWERRVKGLQDNQNRISYIMEDEFNKAYKEIERSFPTLAPKDAVRPCQDYKSMVVDCFKSNANQTLNCSKLVNEFTSCISQSRSTQSSGNRSV